MIIKYSIQGNVFINVNISVHVCVYVFVCVTGGIGGGVRFFLGGWSDYPSE